MISSNFTINDEIAFTVTGPAGTCIVASNDQGLYGIDGDANFAGPLGIALEEAVRRTAGNNGHADLDTTIIEVGDLLEFLFPHAEPFTRNLTELLDFVADELGWEPITIFDVERYRLVISDLLPAGLTLHDNDTITANMDTIAPDYQAGHIAQQITTWCRLRQLRDDLINEIDNIDPQQLATAK